MKIGVALCSFNGAKYIEEQVQSILLQTVKPNEIIICDDCSSDNTIEIIQKIKLNYPDVVFEIIQNEKRIGAKDNFAKAISMCKADIIFLSDQDDVWLPNKIEEFLYFFNNHQDKRVVFSNALLVRENGDSLESKTLFDILNFNEEAKNQFYKGFFFELENNQNRVTGATMAFYRSYILEKKIIPFVKGEIWHDEIIAINATLDNCIGFIDKCLIKYRIHSTQQAGLDFEICNNENNEIWKYKPLNFYYCLMRDDFKTHKNILFYKNRESRINSILGFIKILMSYKQYKMNFDDHAGIAIKSDIKLNLKMLYRKFTFFLRNFK